MWPIKHSMEYFITIRTARSVFFHLVSQQLTRARSVESNKLHEWYIGFPDKAVKLKSFRAILNLNLTKLVFSKPRSSTKIPNYSPQKYSVIF